MPSIFSRLKRQNLRRLNRPLPFFLPFLSSFFLKNLPILISFYKFDRSYMQSQLLAVLALGGEETGQMDRRSRICRLQPLGCRAQADRLDFALDTPWAARFDLLRLMP